MVMISNKSIWNQSTKLEVCYIVVWEKIINVLSLGYYHTNTHSFSVMETQANLESFLRDNKLLQLVKLW